MNFDKQTSLDGLLKIAKEHKGDGPNEAWGELLLRMIKKQRALPRKLLGRRASDENNVLDLEASTLEKILSDRSTVPNDFETVGKLGGFIGQALRFKGIDEHRINKTLKRGGGKRHVSIDAPSGNGWESHDHGSSMDLVDWDLSPQARALFEEANERFHGRLTAQQKQVLDLYLEQTPLEDIATKMDCSRRTIDRALYAIRAIASEEYLDIPPGNER